MLNNYYKNNNQKGQALLFVIVALTIALAIGINASVRTITSISRTTRTDTASRSLAASEGGIERYLAVPSSELEDYLRGGDCPSGSKDPETGQCLIDFETGSDDIDSLAAVSVERYQPSFYPFELKSGQVKEINLYDFSDPSNPVYYSENTVKICWTPETFADITYFAYKKQGGGAEVSAHGGLTAGNAGAPAGYYQEGFTQINPGDKTTQPYNYCGNVNIGNDVYGLRIRTVGGSARVAVYPVNSGVLPMQGYMITSIGNIKQDEKVTASKTIKVVRTLPYLPAGFDFAIYSQGDLVKEAP